MITLRVRFIHLHVKVMAFE